MTLKLKPSSSSHQPPFSWSNLPRSPSPLTDPSSLPSPPTSWLSARDMKVFGANPLASDIGVVRCKECDKPVLRSAMGEHSENCRIIRSGGSKKGSLKGKAADDNNKKRKGSPTDSDPSQPAKKKTKPAPKLTKRRFKGPVDFDKHCGVINEKNVPCSRSLTCKSHSMGAKRAVQGRSKLYDDLLLEWHRANNPNFVEPVKRETKAEKKEKREKEKAEKKKAAMEAAIAAGLDPNKKTTGGNAGTGAGTKKGKKGATAAAAAAVATEGVDEVENLDDLDSEAEVDDMTNAFGAARDSGTVAVPLAVPYDAGSWFVERREKVRNCRHALLVALANTSGRTGTGIAAGAPRLT